VYTSSSSSGPPGLGLDKGHHELRGQRWPPPETRYARTSDGVHIAYHVFGRGEMDVVFVWGIFSHVELLWEHEASAHYLRRLGSFARVIHFDKRGTGLSDRACPLPTLEDQMDDVWPSWTRSAPNGRP